MRIQFNILKKLGLTDTEVRIYLGCLEFGGMGIAQLTSKLGIPRSTINDSVKKLIQSGYLSTYVQGKRTVYIAASIEELAAIQKKRARDSEDKADLLLRHSLDFQEIQQQSFIIPHVKYYQGKDATEIIYRNIYNSSSYYAFFSADEILEYASDYDEKIVTHLVDNQIPHKLFLTNTPEGKKLLMEYHKLGLNARLLPQGISFPTDNIILDNKFLYISYAAEKITAIEIKDEMFAKTQRAIFDAAWNAGLAKVSGK